MTRSKIQKLKFFIFLLIFLLAQTAICDGSFREKRDVPSTDVNGKAAPVADAKNGGTRNERLDDKDGQRNAAGSQSVDAKRPAADSNRTHDGITSKPLPPDIAVANKTAHTVDTSNEVRIFEAAQPSFHNHDFISPNINRIDTAGIS